MIRLATLPVKACAAPSGMSNRQPTRQTNGNSLTSPRDFDTLSAMALGAVGEKRAAQPLINALEDENSPVREAVAPYE